MMSLTKINKYTLTYSYPTRLSYNIGFLHPDICLIVSRAFHANSGLLGGCPDKISEFRHFGNRLGTRYYPGSCFIYFECTAPFSLAFPSHKDIYKDIYNAPIRHPFKFFLAPSPNKSPLELKLSIKKCQPFNAVLYRPP